LFHFGTGCRSLKFKKDHLNVILDNEANFDWDGSSPRWPPGGRTLKALAKKSKKLADFPTPQYTSEKYTAKQICDKLKIVKKGTLYNYQG